MKLCSKLLFGLSLLLLLSLPSSGQSSVSTLKAEAMNELSNLETELLNLRTLTQELKVNLEQSKIDIESSKTDLIQAQELLTQLRTSSMEQEQQYQSLERLYKQSQTKANYTLVAGISVASVLAIIAIIGWIF